MINGSQFVLAGLLILALVQVGTGLRCFQCGEAKGGDGICRDEAGNKHVTKDCPASQVCITHWTSPLVIGQLQTPETLIKVCGDRSYCDVHAKLVEKTLGVTTKGCTICTTDYCNSGSTVVPSFIVIALLGVKYLFS